MNTKEMMEQIGQSYRVDPAFAERVTAAARKRPARRRAPLRLLIAAALILLLAVSAAAAGIGLLAHRLSETEYEGQVIGERIPGYLAAHLDDTALEGVTEDGTHIVFTNLLAESRFLYVEVLAERPDGKPLAEGADAEDPLEPGTKIYFHHFGMHYGEAGSVGGDWEAGVGSACQITRLDDGSDPCFAHCVFRLTLMQRPWNWEQMTKPDKTRLTIQLLDEADRRDWPEEGILAETTVTLTEPESLRTVLLADGGTVRLSPLGAELRTEDWTEYRREGIEPQDCGVILADGSRVPFWRSGDFSLNAAIPQEYSWAAVSYTEILDPAGITGLYFGERSVPIETEITEP